jgi:hypothetical protein
MEARKYKGVIPPITITSLVMVKWMLMVPYAHRCHCGVFRDIEGKY